MLQEGINAQLNVPNRMLKIYCILELARELKEMPPSSASKKGSCRFEIDDHKRTDFADDLPHGTYDV